MRHSRQPMERAEFETRLFNLFIEAGRLVDQGNQGLGGGPATWHLLDGEWLNRNLPLGMQARDDLVAIVDKLHQMSLVREKQGAKSTLAKANA